MSAFDVEALRRRFPALALEDGGRPVALFDGPSGTQVPDTVIAADRGLVVDRLVDALGRIAAAVRPAATRSASAVGAAG
jgi:selenocysteine lyase/cysteine desulfurase